VGPLFLILWVLAQSKASIRTNAEVGSPQKQIIAERSQQPFAPASPTPTLRPGEMSMYSAYAAEEAEEQKLKVRCKTDRSLNNIEIHIPIEAVAEEDVISRAGKILIPSGTKVVGQGYCDAEAGRIVSRGKWTFYASDYQVRVNGTMRDATRKEGLAGTQFAEGLDQERVKQAIYRDGAYLYVPSQTDFILQLEGNIEVQNLPSAYDK
jgi:hypothetical protein